MSVAALLLQLVAKTFFLALPLGVALLGFRRLMLSETLNAWIYAAIGLFAAFTVAGLAPWAFGFQPVNWMFLIFAFLSPPLWMACVIICGIGRPAAYDVPEVAPQTVSAVETAPDRAPLAPLVLQDPKWPETSKAVFRTHRTLLREARTGVSAKLAQSADNSKVLDVARAMRGNLDTQKRRKRVLLPPPHAMSDLANLPFLQR